MKTTTKIAVAFVALAGVAGATLSAQADSRWQARQDSGQPMQMAYGGHDHGHGYHRDGMRGEGPRGGMMLRMMESFDTNGDGKLSQAEIDESRGARFGKFDADGDGVLNLQEYEQLWLDAMREVMVDRFQDLDADGNAGVTAEEFARPFQKMVERRDRNGDGVIDKQDFQRRMPPASEKPDNG